MVNVIELKHLTKMYGSDRGVVDISLAVPKGSVFGFLGPNGAGKTTTIAMMVNLTHPTSGKIKIFGEDNEEYGLAHRSRIGYLAGDMALDGGLTGWQQLEYFGHLRGSFNKSYTRELAHRLDADLKKRIKSLSRGNRQKIGLIAALMHRPELLILDEPTSGLDPLVQAEFNKVILEAQKEGRTTFISSHVLSEVQELCDELAIIREGKLVIHTTLKELIDSAPRAVRLSTDGSYHPAQIVKGLDGVSNLHRHDHTVTFNYTGDINELLARLAKRKLRRVVVQEAGLEDIFMSYYTDEEAADV